ncbi:MAG: hypothetical protein U9R02_09115 [Thermodesulfobacteriota bacterium]|nr:hypothetical protein [Thermodesulfobacteriota bacterium]
MDYIAKHYNMDLALVWALRLEGKTDQEKFKELGWGLRTWNQRNFNECLPREIHVNDKQSVFHWGDERFGDDWPARHRSRPKEAVSAPLKAFAQARRAGGILNPHLLQKRIPIIQSQYLITTDFYLKQDGK